MSIEEKIRNVLIDICKDVWPMVCPRDKPPEEYIVYNPEIDVPSDFGDNAPGAWIQHVQVHYFVLQDSRTGTGDYRAGRRKIRSALLCAGFSISEIATLYEKDSGYNHLCFSCSIVEDMEE